MKLYFFALALFLNVAAEQDFSSLLQNLEHKSVQDFVNQATHIDASSLANLDDGEEKFKEKCLKNGNNESYDNAMAAKAVFQKCIKGLLDFETLQEEIEKAKPTGDLDLVFKKYCRRSPKLKSCVGNLTEAVEVCLDEGEKLLKSTVMNISDSLISFVCHKEGDRIALFMAENGPECLMSNIAQIQECINATFHHYLPEDNVLSNASAPEIVIDEEQCRNVNQVRKCVVIELEKCKDPTPANIVESLIKFIWKSTPCSQFPVNLGLETSGSWSPSITPALFFASSISIILMRLF